MPQPVCKLQKMIVKESQFFIFDSQNVEKNDIENKEHKILLRGYVVWKKFFYYFDDKK